MSKHPGGRPSKYKPEYVDGIVAWFEEKIKAKELPFLSKWARTVAGVSEQTSITWTEKEPEFFEAYKKAKEIQKEFLIYGGLTGLFNSTFAIFTAKNITDMRDQTQIDHTTKGEKINGFNYVAPNDSNNNANAKATSGVASSEG